MHRSEKQLNKEDHGMKDVPVNIRNRLLEVFTQKAEVWIVTPSIFLFYLSIILLRQHQLFFCLIFIFSSYIWAGFICYVTLSFDDLVRTSALYIKLPIQGDKGAVVYRMTDKLKDKIVAYILALALHVDGFTIELDKITHDLKYGNMCI